MNKHIILLILFSALFLYCRNGDETTQRKANHETINGLTENTGTTQKTPEETLRDKLNATEKSNLDFLKDALNDKEKFNQLLNLDEGKIKAALEHIKNQLANCNDEQKKTFKQVLQGYFDTMSDNKLDEIQANAISGCQAGG
ncbi:Mlp lipoprotein family protein (plasmid) [Borrelia nietonii YOR]|uniref:Mlp lipoprotein family protein n=2 Tax=Borrelia TaxID=138 RepID=W5T844_BORHE|nr:MULTISPECIES: Mlp family lipoprotein [Borrelia]AHH03933.1 Mlp lipoprotein family protein [Borrelia nietonii YOR]AHH13501.1 Mlp lipoprotein family protein [Borrelia hermsii YBT]UPA10205.1 Mlp family lipoprotein [Borrelia nietonii YOR]